MNELLEIVNTYKARRGIRFDKQMAEELHVKQQTLSGYLNGKSQLPQILIAQLAKGAELPPLGVMAAANITYEKTPETEKEFWAKLLDEAKGNIKKL